MKPTANPILIGIIAGLASAVLMALVAYAPFISIVLVMAAFTSIFIAGLGFGLMSCLIAIAVASIANSALYASAPSLIATAVTLMPAAVMSYLANLARPAREIGGPDTAMAWFPLSDILLSGAIVTAIATIVSLLINPYVEANYIAIAEASLQMMSQIDPQIPIDPGMKDQLVAVLRVAGPLTQGAQVLIALFGGLYFAIRILSAAGRITRPREDMRSSLRMNRLAIAVFLAGLVLVFAGGAVTMIGASFAGAVAGGFMLSGYAIVHNAVRGKSWALPALVLIYLLSFIIWPLAFVIIVIGGLANPRRAIALTPNKSSQDPSNQP